jgi:hypothetical protein
MKTCLSPTEEDPARLWAEIHALRAAVQGPEGFATWQDSAVAERVRRVKMQTALRTLYDEAEGYIPLDDQCMQLVRDALT